MCFLHVHKHICIYGIYVVCLYIHICTYICIYKYLYVCIYIYCKTYVYIYISIIMYPIFTGHFQDLVAWCSTYGRRIWEWNLFWSIYDEAMHYYSVDSGFNSNFQWRDQFSLDTITANVEWNIMISPASLFWWRLWQSRDIFLTFLLAFVRGACVCTHGLFVPLWPLRTSRYWNWMFQFCS